MAVIAFFQILFLYMQIYIPFIAVFWLMFGGENGREKVRQAEFTESMVQCNETLKELTDLRDIVGVIILYYKLNHNIIN